jgi:hypothetical protein
MRCLGQFHDDRTCDICATVNPEIHRVCKQRKFEKDQMVQYLRTVAQECPHRETCLNDYDQYDGCTKNGYNRYYPHCKPTLECKRI